MGLKTGGPCVCAHVTLNKHKNRISIYKKKRLIMTDDSAPTHKRRKLVKTYKNVLPQKQTVVAEVSWETYSKI